MSMSLMEALAGVDLTPGQTYRCVVKDCCVVVQVTPLDQSIGLSECDWDDSPEGIADWLNWLDSIEPLNFTEQELADIEANCHSQKRWEYQMFSAHADKLDNGDTARRSNSDSPRS